MLDTTYIEKSTGFSETTIESVLNSFIELLQLELRAGNEVEVTRFGVFYPKEFGERQARNPRTGESLIAKPRTKPRVRFSSVFEESIQDPSLTSTPPLTPPSLATPSTPPTPSPTPDPPATSIPPSIPVAAMTAMAPPPVPPAVVEAVEVVRIWHIAKDGVSTAYPESKLKGKGKGKHNIAPDSLVWTEGFPAWKSASDVPELAYLFN